MSMDSSGKIMWAKHSEIQQANLKAMTGQGSPSRLAQLAGWFILNIQTQKDNQLVS